MDRKITSLIDTWPTRRALAEEVGASEAAVHKWASNNRIPSSFQARVVRAARRRGLRHITPAWMLEAHDADGAGKDAA